jgi:cytochrome c
LLFRLVAVCVCSIHAVQGTASELHSAAERGDLTTVKRALAAGAKIEAEYDGKTPLYVAARAGRAETVSYLLAAGADPRRRMTAGWARLGTPIHGAALSGQVEVIRLLVAVGVDPNLPDEEAGPPLHLALRWGDKPAADLLRSLGAAPMKAQAIDEFLARAETARGELLSQACAVCHVLSKEGAPSKLGPTLWNVLNRPKASVPDYAYSDALREMGGAWTYAELNGLLAEPRAFAPGTRMEVKGWRDVEDRSALIAYLRLLADNPAPLPTR